MSPKADVYRRHFHDCNARAGQCGPEIAALWQEIASSYRFLMEREARIAADERDRLDAWGAARARHGKTT
jgi:hypothetical protein